jgi:IMP dehydrogenase
MQNIRLGLSFDDVLLVPSYSAISSRSEIDLSVNITGPFKFETPIIPANMKNVSGQEMARAVYMHGGLAVLHRFMSFQEQAQILENLCMEFDNSIFHHVGVSLGVKKEDYENALKFFHLGVRIFCIDIAHGDSKLAVDMCTYLAINFPDSLIIAGNVATAEGARRLWKAGAHVVKVGIGGGSLCTTRVETGAGVPQLTALMDVNEIRASYQKELGRPLTIIADGGIKNAGDCVKALCFADMVMVGNLFAGTNETPGECLTIDGHLVKQYEGSSTHKTDHVEGVKAFVPTKGPVAGVFKSLHQGIRSGVSYQGATNLTELQDEPQIIRMSASGLRESHPHDVKVA